VRKKTKRRFVRREGSLLEELAPHYEYVADSPHRQPEDLHKALAEARAATIDDLFARVEVETAAGVFSLRNDRYAVRAIIERALEPGVRARVGALFAKGPAEDDLSRKFARAFGGESRAWLLARIEPHLGAPRTLGRARAWMCLEAAATLLEVDPQEHRAACFLVALVEHEDRDVRHFAVERVVSRFLAPSPSSAVHLILRSAIETLVDADDDMFVGALPALLSVEHAKALARATSLLFDQSQPSHVRRTVVGDLLNDRWPYRNLPTVLRWLAESATLREQIEAVWWLAPVLPASWLSRTLARGLADESPSLRDVSRHLLGWLPPARERVLLERALHDEPDPYLRRVFRDQLRTQLRSKRR
jgi:hypothetical protein